MVHRPWLPWLAAACLTVFAGAPLLAQGQKAAIRPFTTDQLAAWLCKALPTKDGAKISKILFDGQVPGEVNDGDWTGMVIDDGKSLLDVDFMSMGMGDVGAWVLSIDLEGDWHGISEADWVALAKRMKGRVEENNLRGFKICAEGKKDCRQLGGYEAAPGGVRWLQVVWGSSDPDPSTWFCAKS